jgi:hypothetical protein
MSDFSKLPPVEYETRDVDARAISRTAAMLAVVIVLSALVAWGFFRFLQHQDEAQRASVPEVARHEPFREPPAPRLQRTPFDDVQGLRREEAAFLEQEYRWVEKDRVARIPIEDAIRLYVERAGSGNAATPFSVAPMAAVPASPAAAPAAQAHP